MLSGDFTPWAIFKDILFFLVCYGAWRGVRWFIESLGAKLPWRAIKLWVPSITLLGGCAATWAQSLENVPHAAAVQTLVGIFYSVNLPGTMGAAFSIDAFGVIRDMDKAPAWERLLAGSVGWWLAWYAVVRFLEWRSSANNRTVVRI